MKGFCALLLAWMMTGMVVGQQPQSSNFQARQNNSVNSNLLGKYLLVMTDEYVRSMKDVGYLSADIEREGQASIDHVVLHGSERNSRRSDLEPFAIEPLPLEKGDKRLQFLLTDQHLKMMNQHGLMYVIPAIDRGRYSTVQVIYDSLRNASSTTADARQSSQFQDQQLADQASNRRPDFIGPRLPDNWETRQNGYRDTDQNDYNNINDAFQPQLDPIASRRDSSLQNNFNDRASYDNRQFQNGTDFDQRQRTTVDDNRFADRQNTFVPSRNDRDFSNSDLTRRNPADRQTGSLGSNAPWDMQAGSRSRIDQQTPRVDQVDESADLWVQQQMQIRNDNARELNRLQQERLAWENEQLETRLYEERLESQRQNELLRQQPGPRYASNTVPIGGDRDLASLGDYAGQRMGRANTDESVADPYGSASYQQYPRDRLAGAPRPTNKPIAFSIPAPTDQTLDQQTADVVNQPADPRLIANAEFDRIHKQNAALWFIMLCSIGLNFYLSWISRGFYVRYEELADELRESFTSTMS